ncbi:MAG: hypothetical protein ACYDA1_09305 [Vulcanimicrobiaceae bacterium]
MKLYGIFAFVCAVFGSSLPVYAAAPPSAEQFYLHALMKTEKTVTPPYVTFAMTVNAVGGHFDLSYFPREHEVKVSQDMERNVRPKQTYEIFYRGSDGRQFAHIDHDRWNNEQPTAGRSRIGLLVPTWRLTTDWGRYGNPMGLLDPTTKDRVPAAVNGSTASQPVKALKTISIISAASPYFYRVSDEGAHRCENGDPGHMVHLVARRDSAKHQLTDATIDLKNGLLCMARFGEDYQVGPVGIRGYIELHYAAKGPYWMLASSTIVEDFRAAGIAVRHMSVQIRNHDFSFPAYIPSSQFETAKAPRYGRIPL